MPASGENKVIDIILNRRSVREFNDRPISKEEINKILNAGRWAPSGLNNQPWRFIVIRDPETILKLSECTHYSIIIEGAPPLLIAAFLDTEFLQQDKGCPGNRSFYPEHASCLL